LFDFILDLVKQLDEVVTEACLSNAQDVDSGVRSLHLGWRGVCSREKGEHDRWALRYASGAHLTRIIIMVGHIYSDAYLNTKGTL
jgi:hypothetical protein